MVFTIIKNAPPAPPPTSDGRGVKKYPFADMEIGDAFDVPVGDRDKADARHNILNAANSARRRSGKRFVVRIMPCGTVVRVWRVA